MATFKICVRKKRKDGFFPVYIRITHNRVIGYIKTDKLVYESDVKDGDEVHDPYVVKHCTELIVKYVERLNMYDTNSWTLNDIIDFLKNIDVDLCFSDYARTYRDRMINNGQERNARNYDLALQHLERYVGTNKVMFPQLTSNVLTAWIDSMKNTRRAKEMYPICMRQVFKSALKEYNDYDRGILRIKNDPWQVVSIPRSDVPEQLAITPQECRDLFAAPLPESKYKEPLPELGRDVAMMVLCLGGINTVDIYNMQKRDYYDGILHYNRSKTMKHRTDKAYMEMRVPPMIQPILEKYFADPDDPYLFSFHKRHTTSDSFGANANRGLKEICESMGMKKEDQYCMYTFRHTWGTIAQNDCGANMDEVAFGMNHSNGRKVTRGYVKINFEPAWELNEKVIELIFFTEKESRRTQKEDTGFGRFSPKHLMRGTVFFKGRSLGKVEDIGFNNVEEIIARLIPYIPEDVPERSIVQFKIENLDKQKVSIYERQKGKGF